MGFRVNTGTGIDPKMVEQLMELERQPVKRAEERRDAVLGEQKEFNELKKLVADLGTSLNTMRTKPDFYRMKIDSSHPDIIMGTADSNIVPGSYEVELLNMARTHKLLAESFPDKDETPVGFGYMVIELEDGSYFDVEIDPDRSTLNEVASAINDANAGVKAIVMNTKEYLEDRELESYRLLVISEKSGKEAKVYIDPDTTYLEFKEQVTGRNLEMLFEDVMVYDEDNVVDELLPGLTLNAKRAEPGTKVQLEISYDVDATMENIRSFVENYNKVSDFIDQQFQVNPSTGQAGVLARGNTLRSVRRALQNSIQYQGSGVFRNLAEVGITTDPKTGALRLDEAKVSKALSEKYVEVAKLFIQTEAGLGVGTTLSDSVRGLQNRSGGALSSKDREYSEVLRQFEDDIQRKERLAGQRAESVKRRFTALEQLVSGLNSQGEYVRARLGGASPLPGGG
jgi:flagellar hook-associated protein 2